MEQTIETVSVTVYGYDNPMDAEDEAIRLAKLDLCRRGFRIVVDSDKFQSKYKKTGWKTTASVKGYK